MWGSEDQRRAFAAVLPLWHGGDATRDRKRAAGELRTLADAGYAPAQFGLGMAHFDGEGVRRDYTTAFALFMSAAEQRYPSAEGGIGNFYLMAKPEHDTCPYDPAEAARWHRRASEGGNAGSLYNLAFSCWTGRGIPKNEADAYVWSSLAVKCSTIRFRPAETLRNNAAATLDESRRAAADARIAELGRDLPHPWSDHLSYWRSLADAFGVC